MERKSALPRTSLDIPPPVPPMPPGARLTDCATASAEIGRGLHQLLESNGDIIAIVSEIHKALSKEPPKSKIPEALAELTAEVRALRVAIEGGVKQ